MNDTNKLHVETEYGVINCFKGDLISSFLQTYGEWAPFETYLARHYVRSDTIVIDAGAFIGSFSLSLLGSPLKKCIAVEGNKVSLTLLKENLSDYVNLGYFVESGVLGLDSRYIEIFENNKNLGSTYFRSFDIHEPKGKVLEGCCPRISLSSMRKKYGNYHLLKLDVEGCELDTLKEDKEYIANALPVLLIEANETKNTLKVAAFCLDAGYNLYYFSLPTWRMNNPKKYAESYFPLAHEAVLLAVVPGIGLPDVTPILDEGGFVRKVNAGEDILDALWLTPRWSKKEWLGLTKEQLIGQLGHYDRIGTLKAFREKLTKG